MAKGLNVWVNIGGKLLPSLNSSVNAVPRLFSKMNRSLRIQAAETKLALREMSAAMSPIVGMMAAGGLSLGFEKAIENSSHLAHEMQNLRNAGRPMGDIAKAMTAANKAISALPTTTLVDNLAVLNETTGAFGNFQHAIDNLTFNQRIGSMMQNMLGDAAGSPGEMFNNIARAMEMRGSAQDAGRYQREVGELYKAMVFTGGRVNPAEFFGYAQQANPYIKGMSQRYMTRIAPSLIQEFGGDRAGTMQNTWTGTILGKAKNKISTEAWMALGLLDPKQVVYNKVGPVGWKPGAIKGTDQALQDPLKWSETVLIPALKAHGFKTSDQLSLAKALMPLFRDRNANRLANVLVADKDRARLHKDEGLIDKVPDAAKAYRQTLRYDPGMAWTAMKASFSNLSSVLFGSGRGESPVAIALVHTANGVNMLAQALERHPLLANGAGGLLGLSAGAALLKTFGVALGWVFAPLAKVGRLLFSPVGASGPRVPWIVRAGQAIMRVAGPVGEGLAVIGEALGAVSAPLWGGIAAGALAFAGAGVWIYRNWAGVEAFFGRIGAVFAPLGKAFGNLGHSLGALASAVGAQIGGIVTPMINKLWDGTKGLGGALWDLLGPLAIDKWKRWGSAVAGVLKPIVSWVASIVDSAARGVNSLAGKIAPAPGLKLAGKRAMGGPVLGGRAYLVGERGPEIFHAPMSGSIMTASRTDRLLRDMHGTRRSVLPAMPRDRRGSGAGGNITYSPKFYIHGTTDPDAVARAVDRKFRRMANGQAHLLSD